MRKQKEVGEEVLARKDAVAREAILARLQEKLWGGAKSLLGNRGYARFLKMAKGSFVENELKRKEMLTLSPPFIFHGRQPVLL